MQRSSASGGADKKETEMRTYGVHEVSIRADHSYNRYYHIGTLIMLAIVIALQIGLYFR
jgi:hypothetical protein